MKKRIPKVSKEGELHVTTPPRLEGVVKNRMMNPIRKKKKKKEERGKEGSK